MWPWSTSISSKCHPSASIISYHRLAVELSKCGLGGGLQPSGCLQRFFGTALHHTVANPNAINVYGVIQPSKHPQPRDAACLSTVSIVGYISGQQNCFCVAHLHSPNIKIYCHLLRVAHLTVGPSGNVPQIRLMLRSITSIPSRRHPRSSAITVACPCAMKYVYVATTCVV